MLTISAREANQQFSRILETAANGQVVTITRRGVPVARLVPVVEKSSAADVERERRREEILARFERGLEGRACASPVGLSAAEWQIAGRKIWNWGEKNQHIRDAAVVAGELLEEPEMKAIVPRLRALPPQRVAVIGHSFTMDLHWASPSAFVPNVEL